MPIPPGIKSQADRELTAFCAAKAPAHLQSKIRLSVKWVEIKVTLIEHRPFFLDPAKWTESPVAQLRFDAASGQWSLYCCDRNHRWHSFEPMPSSPQLHKLIAEINRDQTGIFWG